MGYTRRRAVLHEIERLCAVVLSAYGESAAAIQSSEPERFWRSLELLLTAADQIEALLWPGETAEWLGVPERSPLHHRRLRFSGAAALPLPDCARFFDADALPSLLAAVAELGHRVEEESAYLRRVV
jgi:hypothetical protein